MVQRYKNITKKQNKILTINPLNQYRHCKGLFVFLKRDELSRGKYYPYIPVQPLYQQADATTNGKNHPEANYNSSLPVLPPNHHRLSFHIHDFWDVPIALFQNHPLQIVF